MDRETLCLHHDHLPASAWREARHTPAIKAKKLKLTVAAGTEIRWRTSFRTTSAD